MSRIRDSGFALRAAVTIAWLVAGLVAGGERVVWAAPAAVADAQAKQWFVEGRHLEAAVAYEELWGERQEPRFLFNAAMARELSGHELQAFVHLHRYLRAAELTAEERREVGDRLRSLKARTRQARIIVSPATIAAGALTLRLKRAPDGSVSDRGRSPVVLDGEVMRSVGAPGYDGAFDLSLEPGRWYVEVAADGHETHSLSFAVEPTTPRVEVVMRMLPAAPKQAAVPVSASFEPARAVVAGIDVSLVGPTPVQGRVDAASAVWSLQPGDYTLEAKAPRFKRAQVAFAARPGAGPVLVRLSPETRYEVVALGVVGGAALVTGAVVSAVSGARLRSTLDTFTGDAAAGDAAAAVGHRDDIAGGWSRRVVGMRVTGVGLGLGLGALTAALEHRAKRPHLLYVGEAVAGAGLAAIALGLTWALPRREFVDSLDAHYCGSSQIAASDAGYCTPQRTDRLDLIAPTDPFSAVRRIDAGNLFGGLGIGLVTASVVNLIKLAIDKKHDTPRKVAVSSSRGGVRVDF